MADKYDLILVGSSFASSFFLKRYLEKNGGPCKVLVLERGKWHDHAWQLENRKRMFVESANSFTNRTPTKPWNFINSFGGSSNGWWACTPRMLPEDFEQHTRYGKGQDWPLSYDDLEEYYCLAEEIMSVAGPLDGSPFPRSRPYPQGPHRQTDPDRLLKDAYPELFFAQPCARPTQTTANRRPRCCNAGVCSLCPIDSKFTILNEMSDLYRQPGVTLLLGACAERLEIGSGVARGVHYTTAEGPAYAEADFVGLGANAIFNPWLLLRSGLEHPELGTGLVEQVSTNVIVELDGVDNFQGSTAITGHGYMLYSGPHRAERAGALIETFNIPLLRMERGKWRHRLQMKFIYENLRQAGNRVTLDSENPSKPQVEYRSHSAYATASLARASEDAARILAHLPVERIRVSPEANGTESHVMGTTPMGNDPRTSIVDRTLRHHSLSNLAVLGCSTFPTAPPANPTLTLCALSLWAADQM